MKNLIKLYRICKKSSSSFILVLFKNIFYRFHSKNILAHQRVIINGVNNIYSSGLIKIGIDYVGFVHNKDVTYLNIGGKLEAAEHVSIGRGCRFDIAKGAVVKIGADTYINPFTNIIIMHGLEIGKNCAISWNCQFLDEDFHKLQYKGKKEASVENITIGDRVWIGSNVSIFKGTNIPNGCVIAANSVVKGTFEEENVLIAGNPAKIVKREIKW